MDLFSTACENFGLIINTERAVVMHQPPPNTASAHNVPQISVNGTQLQRWTTSRIWAEPSPAASKSTMECTRTIPKAVSLLTSLSLPTLSNNVDRPPEQPPPSSSSSSTSSSSAASTSAAAAPAMPINTAQNPDTPTNTNATIVNNSTTNPVYTCSHCDRTFTTHIGLVGHPRIHHTETGAWSTHLHPPHPLPLSKPLLHIHSPHGPIRTLAHPRKPAVDNRRLNRTTNFSLATI
nr:unnamed protein product [Spirometra erinaceieuropaei]